MARDDDVTVFGQPRVSDLNRGKISKFSVDTLMAMLWHAGVSVRFVLSPRKRAA